ncbi:hypothetical protein OQA88_2595 [Cercophora sp. LCS_1]
MPTALCSKSLMLCIQSSRPTVRTKSSGGAPVSSSALPSATPVVQGIPLVSARQALPDKLRAVFPFELFNAVQSKCFDLVYKTDDNVVVSAPTGSGKTAVLELAICKLAVERGNENLKIVYQAPTKALCSERARDWEKKFSHMSLKCMELTGDTASVDMNKVGAASIIVTTPEKWDSITRKWFDHQRLLQMVRLFLIDEVHILKDVRGATLEAVVSRMKTIGANVRFIALSATVPNSEDIATWLGRSHTNQQLPAYRQTFGEEFRPVKLEKFVYSFASNSNDYSFDKFLDSKLPPLVAKHSKQKPILVFCFTRKFCESTASSLAEYVSARSDTTKLWPMPSSRITVINRDLQEMIRFGVAFHHAGLDVQDRNVVEQQFLKGGIGVICCTSTLAVGVNLPCHTVVLKGTVGFGDQDLHELSDLEVMQMLGRAGRPQFDDSATAIILTRAANKERYEKMVSGQEVLESTLHLNLIEHLNSEVGLGTIIDLSTAKRWLAGTFLSVRVRCNPKHYQMTGGVSNPLQIDGILDEICERDMKLLQESALVTATEPLKATEYGRAMSKYMVEFTTMKLLLEIPHAVCMEMLITSLAQASEFNDFRFRPAEKSLFREVNQSPLLLYPIKETINQTWHKVSLLVQAHLGHVQYADSGEAAKLRLQLLTEKKMIFERLQRLVRAVADCKGYERDSVSVKTALELMRALSAESWEGRPTQLTQVPNVGPVGMRKLASRGIRTVHEFADKHQDEIERIMSRQPPFGKKMKDELEKFPRLALDLAVTGHKSQPWDRERPLLLQVSATIRYLNRKGPPNWGKKAPTLTLVAEIDDGVLVYFWRGSIKKFGDRNSFEVNFSVGLRHAEDVLACHASCEDIVGTMVSRTLEYQLPATISLPRRSSQFFQPAPAQKPRVLKSPDFIGDDGIDDSDLLLAEMATTTLAKRTSTDSATTLSCIGATVGVRSPSVEQRVELLPAGCHLEVVTQNCEVDIHPDTDDHFEETQHLERELDSEPVQLLNGKWRCNHACSGDSRTKSGKPCTHRCCKEGLDKPRKRSQPRPKKRKSGELELVGGGDNNQQWQSQFALGTPEAEPAARPPAKRSKSITMVEPKALDKPAPAAAKHKWKQLDLGDMVIDCIDLSNVDDEVFLDHTSLRDATNASAPLRTPPATNRRGDAQWQGDIYSFAYPSRDLSIVNPISSEPIQMGNAGPVDLQTPAHEPESDDFWDAAFENMDWELKHAASKPAFKEGGRDVVLSGGMSKGMTKGADHEELTAVKPVIEPAAKDQGLPSSSLSSRSSESASASTEASSKRREGEPAWVAEFEDQDIVDLLRGYVTFV